jgi:predicted RNase H-like HicB family nuclease
MIRYEIIIFSNKEDEVFIAEVPELPSLKAHGDSQIEALQNAQEAISLWIKIAQKDGLQIPEPKGKLRST